MIKKAGFASGGLLTGIICTVAMVGVVITFIANASPYMTIAEAKASKSGRLHIPGTIIKPTLRQDHAKQTVTFDLKDEKGDVITVVYSGGQQRFEEATQVVMIGGVKDGRFLSDDALVKCPTKYKSEKG